MRLKITITSPKEFIISYVLLLNGSKIEYTIIHTVLHEIRNAVAISKDALALLIKEETKFSFLLNLDYDYK